MGSPFLVSLFSFLPLSFPSRWRILKGFILLILHPQHIAAHTKYREHQTLPVPHVPPVKLLAPHLPPLSLVRLICAASAPVTRGNPFLAQAGLRSGVSTARTTPLTQPRPHPAGLWGKTSRHPQSAPGAAPPAPPIPPKPSQTPPHAPPRPPASEEAGLRRTQAPPTSRPAPPRASGTRPTYVPAVRRKPHPRRATPPASGTRPAHIPSA